MDRVPERTSIFAPERIPRSTEAPRAQTLQPPFTSRMSDVDRAKNGPVDRRGRHPALHPANAKNRDHGSWSPQKRVIQ